jgi:hypothetical protein
MSEITLVNGSAPSTPSAGRVAVFSASSDKHLKIIDDTGTVTDLTDTGGGGGWTVATETTGTRAAVDGEFVLIDASTCVITLPAPVTGTRVACKVITGTVTAIEIRTSGAGVDIDGTDYSSTGLTLTTQYEQISMVSDGTDWFIY